MSKWAEFWAETIIPKKIPANVKIFNYFLVGLCFIAGIITLVALLTTNWSLMFKLSLFILLGFFFFFLIYDLAKFNLAIYYMLFIFVFLGAIYYSFLFLIPLGLIVIILIMLHSFNRKRNRKSKKIQIKN